MFIVKIYDSLACLKLVRTAADFWYKDVSSNNDLCLHLTSYNGRTTKWCVDDMLATDISRIDIYSSGDLSNVIISIETAESKSRRGYIKKQLEEIY